MKRLLMLIIYTLFPIYLSAQQQTDYNTKGDQAMARQDYRDARMWYGEGVQTCDSYSIQQLTSIWMADEQMRPSMRSLMNKCLNCLAVEATENDTTAIQQLIVYYTEGIGTPNNEELVVYWTKQLESLRKPSIDYRSPESTKGKSSRYQVDFFAGYAFAIEAPIGFTFGAVGERLGGYLRFKTNASFKNHAYEFENNTVLSVPNNESVRFIGTKKKNSTQGSAGLVVKTMPWLYLSAGLGYGERTLLYPVETTNSSTGSVKENLCKDMDHSYKGVVAEVDCMIRKGRFYVSVGCNTLNFEYIDLNAGLGVFF